MKNIFDLDGGVMGVLSKVADMLILSILYIIFCLPLFTIGAATTALYYTTVKSIRRGRGYIWRNFWTAFKSNFGKATIMWVVLAALTALLSFNMYYAGDLNNSFGKVLFFIYIILTCIIAMTAVYIFPEQSRFVLSVKDVVRNSFLMSIRHLPFTLLMVVIVAASILLGYIAPKSIIILPACAALLFSFPMESILKKYVPEDENGNADEWYLE